MTDWPMTEEQAILILLEMLQDNTPPEIVVKKALRTVILKWLERYDKRNVKP